MCVCVCVCVYVCVRLDHLVYQLKMKTNRHEFLRDTLNIIITYSQYLSVFNAQLLSKLGRLSSVGAECTFT